MYCRKCGMKNEDGAQFCGRRVTKETDNRTMLRIARYAGKPVKQLKYYMAEKEKRL